MFKENISQNLSILERFAKGFDEKLSFLQIIDKPQVNIKIKSAEQRLKKGQK